VEFCLLGPLELRDRGSPLPLGGVRQRALLALLLLRANEVVSRDQLIDELWAEESPPNAGHRLEMLVSRLRKAAGLEEMLVTGSGGYALSVDPESVDAHWFEDLVDRGRRANLAGRPEQAAVLLAEGLALWRGDALGDLAYLPFARVEAERLEELRLAAIEERIEARLALGEHAQLIGELEALTAANPLQERLRAQLMLALYRAGRQADALDVYQRTRAALVGELGLEPSPALQELECSILQQAPVLDVRCPAVSPPVMLPVSATPFIGRARELAQLTALLRADDVRLLTLTGAGGSGKTRLALCLADTCAADYRDGTWFVSFADITDPEMIGPTLCETLQLTEPADLTSAARLEQWLGERHVLLVLDNLEQLAEGTGVLAEFLSACPGLTLLVTSREPLHLGSEHQYEVPVLTAGDAVDLFLARSRAIVSGAAVDPEFACRICERLDCLPLAIELAAARTKALAPVKIFARLERALPLLTGGPRDAPRRQHTLRATLDWSYELLTKSQMRLFGQLAVFAGGCTLQAAEAVCDADIDVLEALVDRSLVVRDGARYTMLQTIHEYALERLEHSTDADPTRDAHAQWLVGLLDDEHVAAQRWPELDALERLRPERENFRAALEWASDSGLTELVAHLASSLSGVWLQQGQLEEAERWIIPALAREERYQRPVAAEVLTAGRAIARLRGEYAQAANLARRALALWQEIGDTDAIGRAMVDVGITTHFAGDLAGGRVALERGITFARDNTLNGPLAAGLNNLADLSIRQGRLIEARALCDEALGLAARGSHLAVIALINLAHVDMLEGRSVDALNLARRALHEAAGQGPRLWVAWGAIALAWPLAAQHHFEPSGRLLGAALEFLNTAGFGRDWMDEAEEDAIRTILRRHIGPHKTEALINDGRATPLDQAARDVLADPEPGVYQPGSTDMTERRTTGPSGGRRFPTERLAPSSLASERARIHPVR
jgi:predicted ATPase/DNA-binding SARP family transcriptional activator